MNKKLLNVKTQKFGGMQVKILVDAISTLLICYVNVV